jgi:hypothetical protein
MLDVHSNYEKTNCFAVWGFLSKIVKKCIITILVKSTDSIFEIFYL